MGGGGWQSEADAERHEERERERERESPSDPLDGPPRAAGPSPDGWRSIKRLHEGHQMVV